MFSEDNVDTYRYNYGRQYRLEDVKSHNIKLASKNDEVDRVYMEEYIKACRYSSV